MLNKEKTIPVVNGPYGSYPANTVGGALNTLVRYYDIPLTFVEDVKFGSDNTLHYRGGLVGYWRYFEGISHPLVQFVGEWSDYYGRNRIICVEGTDGKEERRLEAKIFMSHNKSPGIIFTDDLATPQLHQFLNYPMLSQFMNDETYKLKSDSGTFFQGGSADPHGKFFFIEFWQPKGVEAFVKYLNDHYRPVFD